MPPQRRSTGALVFAILTLGIVGAILGDFLAHPSGTAAVSSGVTNLYSSAAKSASGAG
jgi:hypothetical protein